MSDNPRVEFMPCLSASHDTEVTNDVCASEANVTFDQAENRMPTLKAMLVAALGE